MTKPAVPIKGGEIIKDLTQPVNKAPKSTFFQLGSWKRQESLRKIPGQDLKPPANLSSQAANRGLFAQPTDKLKQALAAAAPTTKTVDTPKVSK